MIRVQADLLLAERLILERGSELGTPLHLLGETTSTNDEAKRAARNGAPHGSTWVAESQIDGRGRYGRTWFAEPGESLLFSVLLRLACPVSRLPLLALAAGLSVRDAVSSVAKEADVRIKWPNDVVAVRAGGALKKIAGVLVETTLTGKTVDAVIVGIGINVHTRVFPADLEATASSVGLVAGGPADRAELLADVLARFDRDAQLVAARGLGLVHARLSGADALRGQRLRCDQGEGVAEGIDGEGRLLVRKDDGGRVRWSAGEVRVVRG